MDILTRRSLDFVRASTTAGFDAAVTIAARTPGLFNPSRENAGEARRMVDEKMAAACEGAFGAALAWNRFWVEAAFGAPATPHSLATALVEVADAAMRPARRTVRANAKRLTLRGRKR